MILITNHNSQPQSQEISLQELNKYLQNFYLSARKIDGRGRSVIARQNCNRWQQ